MLPWDPLWRLRHVGYPVSPRGYRGLPAFASLSMAGSEGISEATLYNWRKAAWAEGRLLPDGDSTPAGWSSADKFAAVLETAALNEQELAEYCRERGLYPAQIQQWREACAQANDWECSQNKRLQEARRNDEKRIRKLEKELRHKEKSLAETAALLVLSKKLKAIWGGRGKMTSGPDRKEILELQASLRSRERFWDIRVPKIDSIFDNSLVPRPSWSPGVPPQHRKLVAATHRSPI